MITLANKNNYTTLSIAYKLLELNTEAQAIKFVESTNKEFIIQDLYVPAPHASKYGWTQQVSLEEALVDQIQTYYDDISKAWNYAEKPQKKVSENIKKALRRALLNIKSKNLISSFRPRSVNFYSIGGKLANKSSIAVIYKLTLLDCFFCRLITGINYFFGSVLL